MKKLITTIICIIIFQTGAFSQTWDTLPDIPVGLAFPVVVALNGEIHVIGGGGTTGATDIHLRYTPATNTWDTLAPVPYLAQQPAGAVVNGKIHYFGGGYPNSGTPLNSHYMYDPLTNSWSVAASLPIPRVIMEAASVNGKLYAMSGQPDKARMDEYDPITDTWASKNPLPDNDFWYSAIVVHNNEIYRFGGGGYIAPVKHIHKYDSVSDSWTILVHLPISLHAPAGASLGGLIYVAGGYNGAAIDVTQTFDAVTLALNTVTPLPAGRAYHELVTIDTCIYSVGGNNAFFPDMNVSLVRYCNSVNASVNDMEAENSIKVFPNPAAGHLSFESNSMQVLNVELFDLLGVKKMVAEVRAGGNSIDISELPAGIYFYRAYGNYSDKAFFGKITVAR